MSKALDDGVIYPRDQVLAFAYARVAEMKAAQNRIVLARMANHKSTLERALDQAQLAEAEELAMKLRMESDA